MGRPKTAPELLYKGKLNRMRIADTVAAVVNVPCYRLVPVHEDIADVLDIEPQAVSNRIGVTNCGDTAVSSGQAYHFIHRATLQVYDGRLQSFRPVGFDPLPFCSLSIPSAPAFCCNTVATLQSPKIHRGIVADQLSDLPCSTGVVATEKEDCCCLDQRGQDR